MRFLNWYLGPLKKYAVIEGRASRKEYWLFLLINLVVWMILPVSNPIGIVYLVAIWLPMMAVTVRRLHDSNHRGRWVLLNLVPFVGLIVLYWLIIKGTDGDNDYGPDPLTVTALDAGPRPSVILKPSTEAPATKVVQQGSMADELKKLSELKDSGILTEAEFEEQKAKLLETD